MRGVDFEAKSSEVTLVPAPKLMHRDESGIHRHHFSKMCFPDVGVKNGRHVWGLLNHVISITADCGQPWSYQ